MITTLFRKSFLVLLIFTIAWQAGCQKGKPTDIAPQGQQDEYPDQEGWNSTIVSTNKGRVDAIIEYGHMSRYSKKQMVHFDESVKVDFYDTEGNHTSKLTALTGVLNEKTNDVEAVGNVVVVSDSGVTLFTECLKWNQETERIVSDVDVMITTDDGDTLHGTGFDSDPDLTDWTIKQPKGTAHRAIDLSTDRWKKSRKDSSSTDTKIDSVVIGDSTNVVDTDTIPKAKSVENKQVEAKP